MTDVILRSLSFYLHQRRWGTRNGPNTNKRPRNTSCLGRKINYPQISPDKYQSDNRSYSIPGPFHFFFKCFLSCNHRCRQNFYTSECAKFVCERKFSRVFCAESKYGFCSGSCTTYHIIGRDTLCF